MSNWRALFRFPKKRRAASHPQASAPHRSSSPPADTTETGPASGASPSTNGVEQHQLSPPSPIPHRIPSAETPNTNPALESSALTNSMEQQQLVPPGQTLGAQDTTPKVSTSVVNGLKLALRLLKEAVTGIQVPGLEAAVSGVVKVIDIIESVRSNDRDLEDLSHRISSVADAVGKSAKFHPNEEVSEALRLRMEAFLNELEFMLFKINAILSDRNLASRTANSQAYKNATTDVNTRLDRLISQFSVEGILHVELKVNTVNKKVDGIDQKVNSVDLKVLDVDKNVADVKEAQIIQEYEALIEKIPRVHARYHDTATKPSRPCYPGTRIGLLQVINRWIEGRPREDESSMDEPNVGGPSEGGFTGDGSSEFSHSEDESIPDGLGDDGSSVDGYSEQESGYSEDGPGEDGSGEDGPGDTPFLWLCGEVGVGKTTVAHTIAKEQEALRQLGASFFFSRHDHDRQSPHRLFPSIAYQLARFDQGVWRALAEVLKPDPDIVNRGLTEQFTKLILEPLSRSEMAPSRTVVIVIDGLDECSDPASVLDALALGVEYVRVRLRVLVSSRPYAVIQSKFKNTPLYHLATQNHFHDINPTTLSNDVAAYLTWSLREIASRPANRDLPSPWPTAEQLFELISRASGLFIVASTYTKYINDPFEDNPVAQLNRILSRKRVIGSSLWRAVCVNTVRSPITTADLRPRIDDRLTS